MKTEAFLRELETALERESGTIDVAFTLDDIGWDSLAELAFVSLADSKFGVQLEARNVAACKTVADLVKVMGSAVSDR